MDIGPECRLAVYGTLALGQSNHNQLAGMSGRWTPGVVRGRRLGSGQGPAAGYPVFYPDPEGAEVAVEVFESADLPLHWSRLDAFEGEGYFRGLIEVMTPSGVLVANIYFAA